MADTPIINGHRFGWASIEAHIAEQPARDFTEINYSTKNDPGMAKGFGMRILGRTRGEGDHEGSFSILKSEANRLIARLGKGFTLKSFDIVVSYSEDAEGAVVTDTLRGCRIKNVEDNPKQGNEPATVKCDLHIMRVLYNGIDPFEDK